MLRSFATTLSILAILVPASCARAQTLSPVTRYSGMCDASAAVAIGPDTFVVASDEDDVLRVYPRHRSGHNQPLQQFDLTPFLQAHADESEADIEGAARIGNRIYWIGSHATNRNGKSRPGRHRLFATELDVAADKVSLTPIGTPYTSLLKDLSEAPGLRDFKLGKAAKKSPESAGGLNIEGLAATPQGTLLIAFRNPIPGGKALLVPLDNPQEVTRGKAAKLGQPILLPLGGRGIRDILYFEATGSYLIIAGPYDDTGDFKLYRWSGAVAAQPEPLDGLNFEDMHPEALVSYLADKTAIQVISDDGGMPVAGKPCKDSGIPPARKSFRSVWVTL
jgi:hypothetical protein